MGKNEKKDEKKEQGGIKTSYFLYIFGRLKKNIICKGKFQLFLMSMACKNITIKK